jgi:hypothetical protein
MSGNRLYRLSSAARLGARGLAAMSSGDVRRHRASRHPNPVPASAPSPAE